jgi:hypothetical protein
MKNVKQIAAVVLGLVVLTALIGFSAMKHGPAAVSVPAAEIHYSSGSNPDLLGSVSVHNASATGGNLIGGVSK